MHDASAENESGSQSPQALAGAAASNQLSGNSGLLIGAAASQPVPQEEALNEAIRFFDADGRPQTFYGWEVARSLRAFRATASGAAPTGTTKDET